MSPLRAPVLAANWKMHKTPAEARAFMDIFLTRYSPMDDRTVVIFPPAATLPATVDAARARPDIGFGVQNIHWEAQGAYTGEISAPIARGAGASYVLVGHSERRHVFGETDEQTAWKCAAALRAGLTPILCVGEQLAERESGSTDAVVLRQLRIGLSALEPADIAQIAVAYEPVWAIGTGRTATPRDASAVHTAIRAALCDRVSSGAEAIPILYGGSVKRDNADALLAAPEVGGLLVGGASLDAESWAAIVQASGKSGAS
ncbi:MAG TPA: triose-phosphate isomerase [Gemmatimonadaceae bacterium]|nr:triose-phosphate isomerase [Gemmatimonadaceae bacterium]